MARILAIDYGTKRTGIAVTDPLQIIASGLDTVATQDLFAFLAHYFEQEEVETVVVGEPLHLDGQPTKIAHLVVGFVRKLQKLYPQIKVVLHDERYTSEDAKAIILQSGAKRKKRRDKALIDKVSAALILQDYMDTSKGE
ncbi:MAG: Holliday junction resolvase RuvX [Bacteroidota bacterium]